MSKKIIKTIAKLLVFAVIFLALFVFANIFFRPVWLAEDSIGDGEGSPRETSEVGEVAAYEATNEDATAGFYKEPENRIETLFVGASMTSVGITPMELYENYGICAYSITSEAQPVLASYYWVKEAYRLHPDTLKTVVFDVSMMRRDVGKGFYEKALNGMKYSSVKREAIKEASNGMGAVLGYTFPLLTYHSRWAEIKKTDFHKLHYEPRSYLRGYNMRTRRIFDEGTYEDMPLSTSVINENVEARVDVHEKAEKYFKEMVKFCNEKGIKLIMYKTPAVGNWGNKEHFSIQALADSEGVEYLDFVFEPLIDDIGYNPATDSENRKHNNYYGASKLTDWFGKYLTEECGATDVRGNADYSYMDDQLAEYKIKVKNVIRLKEATNVGDYISILSEGGNLTALITVKGSAGRKLSDDSRSKIARAGCAKLSKLDDYTAYIGVIEGGSVKYEKKLPEEERATGDGIAYSGRFPGGVKYTLTSGSSNNGDISSVRFDNEDYSLNQRGINIIVYDNDAETIVDDTCFDTWESDEREPFDTETALNAALEEGKEYEELSPELQKLYLYNERVKNYREATHFKLDEITMDEYISHYKDRENITIFISRKTEDDEEPYIAVIDDGEKVVEEKNVHIVGLGYDIISGSGVSNIIINQKDYSPNEKGANIVVYDKRFQLVVDTAYF
ncbi:MAG: hypothetical protein J5517_01150 [Eubacterium sp.]|nr:hypothetical protein [Eubacterium sp.]